MPEGVLTASLDDVINDPEITVVAQLIGGLNPARSIMLRLLESGKDIVTANKALLAEHVPELFTRARELGRTIAFEAAFTFFWDGVVELDLIRRVLDSWGACVWKPVTPRIQGDHEFFPHHDQPV